MKDITEPIIITALICYIIFTSFQSPSPQAEVGSSEVTPTSATFEDLLDAIEWVESRGLDGAVGDNGNAVGAYQIWKIYVDDCNRILGKNKYTYDDRRDKDKSREMVGIYTDYYENWSFEKYPYYTESASWRNPYDQQTQLERMARIHNGGPQGYTKKSTEKYWQKVKARLK